MVDKRVNCFLVSVFLLVFLSTSVSAIFGITPAKYEFEYVPGGQEEFHFQILGDRDDEFDVIVEGDFSEYVELDRDYLDRPGIVNVVLNFPDEPEEDEDKPKARRYVIDGRVYESWQQVPPEYRVRERAEAEMPRVPVFTW